VRQFDWDPAKEAENLRRHGVSFEEAQSVLDRPSSLAAYDEAHSLDEPRFMTLGWSNRGRLLVVITSEGGPRPRIISARRATKRERHAFTRRSRHP
jgi:uncharacterized protein